jgi:putative phage-type endonuclease
VNLGEHAREWHETRLDGLGGSDAPVVLGVSPYRRPIELWREKVERIIPDGDSPLRLRIGNMIEPLVLDLYREQTGRKVRRTQATRWSKTWPFAFAHLDASVVGERRIVQVKTTRSSDRWGDPGQGPTLGVPPDIYVQELHELAVSGADVADVAVLFGLGEFRVYELPRDDDAIRELMEAEREFWRDVQEKTEPPIDGSEA